MFLNDVIRRRFCIIAVIVIISFVDIIHNCSFTLAVLIRGHTHQVSEGTLLRGGRARIGGFRTENNISFEANLRLAATPLESSRALEVEKLGLTILVSK